MPSPLLSKHDAELASVCCGDRAPLAAPALRSSQSSTRDVKRTGASDHEHGHCRRVHERGCHRTEDGRRHSAAAARPDEQHGRTRRFRRLQQRLPVAAAGFAHRRVGGQPERPAEGRAVVGDLLGHFTPDLVHRRREVLERVDAGVSEGLTADAVANRGAPRVADDDVPRGEVRRSASRAPSEPSKPASTGPVRSRAPAGTISVGSWR